MTDSKDLRTDVDLNKELERWHDRTTADWVRAWYREEAKKHVKEIELMYNSYLRARDMPHNQDMRMRLRGQIDWIKHFFNLKEGEKE